MIPLCLAWRCTRCYCRRFEGMRLRMPGRGSSAGGGWWVLFYAARRLPHRFKLARFRTVSTCVLCVCPQSTLRQVGVWVAVNSMERQFQPSLEGKSLREQEEEVGTLQKQLFNMKLRVFYLEERLAKSGASGGNLDMDELFQENLQQKMLIEENTQELEQRNLLLVKARNAIQSLQARATPEPNAGRPFSPALPGQPVRSTSVAGRAAERASRSRDDDPRPRFLHQGSRCGRRLGGTATAAADPPREADAARQRASAGRRTWTSVTPDVAAAMPLSSHPAAPSRDRACLVTRLLPRGG